MTSEHWTDDHELVELFALGNLRPERKKDLEVHLSRCDSCRKIVDREILLREGIRHYARRNLKRRLRERLGQAVAPVIPWPHILSAAALLIIVVGIGIQLEWQKSVVPTLHDSAVGQPDTTRRADSRSPERSVPPIEELHAAVETDREGEADEIAGMAAGADRQRELTIRDASPSAGLGESRMHPARNILWITGTMLKDEPATDARAEKKALAAGEQRAKVQAPLSKEFAGPRMSASQMPVQMLPQEQQAGILGVREVLTALEERNDSLHVTIFTDDSEFQSQDLRVDAVTDDSVIVRGGNARVGLKIPGALKGKIQ
ncbi:MAG: hypothetical protein WEB33_02995 [Bacteroidota bacterium]